MARCFPKFAMVYETRFILFMLFLSSCSQQQQPEPPQSLEFVVDSTLIDKPLNDPEFGIRFSPPKAWKSMDRKQLTALRDSAERELGNEKARFVKGSLRAMYGYVEPHSRGVMTVARISTFDTSEGSKASENLRRLYLERDSLAEVSTAIFMHQGLKVFQTRVLQSHAVTFKLVFTNKRLSAPVSFDFVLQRSSYPEFIKTIESVIGSVAIQ